MKNYNLQPGLYIVATPIGNLEDITIRALNILNSVDIIACEDTRVTSKLLDKYNIKKRLIKYNDFSNEESRNNIKQQILNNKSIALVSDAGTPLISDPGYKLIKLLIEQNIFITSIPGPCAAINALILSGEASHQFCFYGFLPIKGTERQTTIDSMLTSQNTTSIFYETSKKIHKFLEEVKMLNPSQKIIILREMTKLFEERICGTASELLEKNYKGEMVVIIPGANHLPQQEIDEEILTICKKLSTKDGQKILCLLNPNASKKDIYNLLKD